MEMKLSLSISDEERRRRRKREREVTSLFFNWTVYKKVIIKLVMKSKKRGTLTRASCLPLFFITLHYILFNLVLIIRVYVLNTA